MDERYYDEFNNKFYNPDDDEALPGQNLNWKKIQRGFKRVEDSAYEDYTALNEAINETFELLNRAKAPIIKEAISGQAASFLDGADDLPVKSLVVGISPVQYLLGSPAPDNILPIFGWDKMQLSVGAENLMSSVMWISCITKYIPNATVVTEDKYVSFGAAQPVKAGYSIIPRGIYKENTQYTFIFTIYKTSGTGTNMRVFYTDGTYSQIDGVTAGEKQTFAFTTAPGKTLSHVLKTNQSGVTRIYYEESGLFEGVLTDDNFKPFVGKITEKVFPAEAGTVYGGTLDVTNGVLTVTKGNIESYNGETLPGAWISDRDVYTEGGTPTTGAHVVYDLAEPIIYQMSPTEILTLLGENNIYADTGGIVNLEYRADTKLYVDSLIEPEPDMIADANITNGSYFMVGDSLYIATAAIAAGEEIVPGTNCTLTDVAAALNALNA